MPSIGLIQIQTDLRYTLLSASHATSVTGTATLGAAILAWAVACRSDPGNPSTEGFSCPYGDTLAVAHPHGTHQAAAQPQARTGAMPFKPGNASQCQEAGVNTLATVAEYQGLPVEYMYMTS
jgi:hypothetical protein